LLVADNEDNYEVAKAAQPVELSATEWSYGFGGDANIVEPTCRTCGARSIRRSRGYCIRFVAWLTPYVSRERERTPVR